MQPLNQLLAFALVVVVGLLAYVYFHYICGEPELDPADKDWKKYRDESLNPRIEEDKKWASAVADEAKVRATARDKDLKLFFKKLWNDGIFQWGAIKAFFEYIGEIINWKKYRVVYCILTLIIIGLVKYYIIDKMVAI